MNLHKEIACETEICESLAEHGWLSLPDDDGYDRAGALFEAHATMSSQALDSATVQNGLKDILLGPARLYESLREQSAV